MKVSLRNLQKIILQYCVLPFVYWLYKSNPVDDKLVVFADSKHDGIPYSLKAMYNEVTRRGYRVVDYCHDYNNLDVFGKLEDAVQFMKLYARAKYVFICDYYLPVSSCNKKQETKVIQLWHASGAFKKFGFDTTDDLKGLPLYDPTRNFDLVSVSSEYVADVYSNAWHLTKQDQVLALGTSRTDILFDEAYKQKCVEAFRALYPAVKGKKIVLWAPTFRGNGAFGELVGYDDIKVIAEELKDEFYFIYKLHPNISHKYALDNCIMTTEELYFVVDTIITDFSSVMFDAMILDKNIILYAPDYEEYISHHGTYFDLKERLSDILALNQQRLKQLLFDVDTLNYMQFKADYLDKCDGKSSERILSQIEKSAIGG